MRPITCFKAYDVRGRVPDELDAEVARRIGYALARYLTQPSVRAGENAKANPGANAEQNAEANERANEGANGGNSPAQMRREILIGHDMRPSSPALASAISQGVRSGGASPVWLGECGSEQLYQATVWRRAAGGAMITASHNPQNYNGIKMVGRGAVPLSVDSGLKEVREMAEKSPVPEALPAHDDEIRVGEDALRAYLEKLLSNVRPRRIRALKIVANSGNGMAAPLLDALAEHLPCEFARINSRVDGTFPNGIPNPLLPAMQKSTGEAVLRHKADFGLAWDGDGDRCCFFDSRGRYINSYYIIGLLAEELLARNGGGKVVHDPRLVWNTRHIVARSGGEAVCSRAGHSLIKQCMRRERAVYGGEISGHHYFRNFDYGDSGMMPWLTVAEVMSQRQAPLADLVAESIARFPASEEINLKVADTGATLAQIEATYQSEALRVERLDGLSMEFAHWRFNVRPSNTEPLLRLNVETRGQPQLLARQTHALQELIRRTAQ